MAQRSHAPALMALRVASMSLESKQSVLSSVELLHSLWEAMKHEKLEFLLWRLLSFQ